MQALQHVLAGGANPAPNPQPGWAVAQSYSTTPLHSAAPPAADTPCWGAEKPPQATLMLQHVSAGAQPVHHTRSLVRLHALGFRQPSGAVVGVHRTAGMHLPLTSRPAPPCRVCSCQPWPAFPGTAPLHTVCREHQAPSAHSRLSFSASPCAISGSVSSVKAVL